MSNVLEFRRRANRKAEYEQQRVVAARAVRLAAVEVQRLAEFSKGKPS